MTHPYCMPGITGGGLIPRITGAKALFCLIIFAGEKEKIPGPHPPEGRTLFCMGGECEDATAKHRKDNEK